MAEATTEVVTDDGRSKISDLWKKEDYWAIWIGFAILIMGYFLFIANVPEKIVNTAQKSVQIMDAEAKKGIPFKTMEWYEAQTAKSKLNTRSNDAGKFIANLLKRPGSWKNNPMDAFVFSKEAADAQNAKNAGAAATAKTAAADAKALAKAAQADAAAASYTDSDLNAKAESAISAWRKADSASSKASAKASAKPFNIFPTLLGMMACCMVAFGIGVFFMGQNLVKFLIAFVPFFFVAILAFLFGAQSTMKYYGIGSEAWAIILGMLIANTVGTPKFMKPALQTEFYIKTGLVLLGAEVLFDKIVAIGIPGIFVAWVVTPTVLIATYIFGQKVLKMESKTLNIVISADMSVCGTSAAIATAAACRAKKEELTLSIGISLVFTAIMMIVLPMVIKALGLPEVLGGAWIGGTVDSTGAVAAAGAFIGEKAMYVAATIKMIQNVMIGVTAFGVALYWCTKVEARPGAKVPVREIWDRFPKFVLGFLAASILASLISGSLGVASDAAVSGGLVRGLSSPLRSWCFCLAFTSIGLATNFRELAHYFKGGKPVILYVCGQSLNLTLTLAMAYVMFYLVFPEITANI